MGRAYSNDLRERVVLAVECGGAQAEVAERFGISAKTVWNYVQRWRRQGHVATDKVGGQKEPKLASHTNRVKALVSGAADQTLAEIQGRLEAERSLLAHLP